MTDALRAALQESLGSSLVLLRELGGGGMSHVYVARDEALGREVVVKVLAPDLARSLSVERFTREIRLVAALQEPHIVPVLAAGETRDGLPWYTMPFVRGETLRAVLSRGPLDPGEALGILRNVAQALAHAHAHGIVHRDIKPENVLLSSGTAMVADFGIAKALSASALTPATAGTLTSVGMSVGTPAYMAPEQAMGEQTTDHRADIYAWGVMAWEVLAGRHPFEGRTTAQALVAAHLTESPATLDTLVPTLAPELVALIARCLEKAPERRPGSMQEVLNALTALLSARVTPVPGATSGGSNAPQGVRRTPWLLGAAAILGLLGGVVAWYQLRPSEAAAIPATPATDRIETLAVLPFTNVGGDPRQEYFSDGISDELSHALARIEGLRLAGRSSSFAYKGKSVPAPEIGEVLDVEGIIEGSVRRAGTRVRITAQLTSTRDGKALWADSYESTSGDVFEVQDSVTRAIVAALTPRLQQPGTAAVGAAATGAAPRPSGELRGTTNAVAYDRYLRGTYNLGQRGAAPIAQAIADFTAALQADSTFARGWAALAQAYLLQVNFDRRARVTDNFQAADRAIGRALAIDSLLGDAHLARAYLAVRQLRFARAESAFAVARRLEPNNPTLPHWYALYLAGVSRLPEALDQLKLAQRLDPQSATMVNSEGMILMALRRPEDARRAVSRMVALDPAFVQRVAGATMAYLWSYPDSALYFAELARTSALPPRGAMGRSLIAAAVAGQWVAYDSLGTLLRRTDPAVVASYDRLIEALVERRPDEAVRLLEASLVKEAGIANSIMSPGCEPLLDPLKDRADYRALMQRLGIPVCPERSPWLVKPRPPR